MGANSNEIEINIKSKEKGVATGKFFTIFFILFILVAIFN